MSQEFPTLRELFTITKQDRLECAYFANEPIHDDHGYVGPAPRFQVFMSKRFPGITVFWYRVTWMFSSIRCRISGHDWVDESYGGPDSGCMAGSCRRCGFSFHTTLY